MQHITTFLLFLIGSLTLAHAQNCLPQGISLNQQWAVDDFPSNYPGCTQIDGFLKIGLSNDITDLTPLSQIISIGGYLLIEYNVDLQTLDGLENITGVGGDLKIENNTYLTDLSALVNITSVGGDLEIRQNGNLPSLAGLGSVATIGGDLTIRSCGDLTDLQGLEGVVAIGNGLSIENNNGLVSLDGLGPVNALGGPLWLKGNALLTDLSALSGLTSVGAQLNLQNNPSLASLDALSGITALDGYLRVEDIPLLTDLSPLADIDPASITQLTLQNLPGVSECAMASICGYLELPNPDAVIAGNAAGCASVEEVDAACSTLSSTEAETGLGNSLLVFPNPSKGLVQLQSAAHGSVELYVIDVMGRIVHSERSFASGALTYTMYLGHLLPGAYLLRMQSDQGIAVTRLTIE